MTNQNQMQGEIENQGSIQQVLPENKLFTDKEACEYLGVSSVYLWKQRKNGQLSYRRVASQIRYTSGDLKEFLERNKQPAIAVAA